MLFFGVAMSLSEIGWTFFLKEDMGVLLYISIISYCIAFMLFASILDQYAIERFGVHFKKSIL